MASVQELKIEVPQEKLNRLQRQLDDYDDWPVEIEDAPWQYGPPVADLKRIVEHWRTKFDWRAHEARLNQLPNFETKVSVDGFDAFNMHFVHQKSDVPGAIPLLFVHGWPGSFLEATKILPLLKGGGGKPAFNIVAPSLPNYGFSDGVFRKGFSIPQYAEACHKVMLALGYDQYVTQGGDWGFLITRALGYLFPQNVKASHVNWAYAAQPPDLAEPLAGLSEREQKHLQLAEKWNPFGTGDGRGYLAIQSTRPLTINYSLRSSPVGLLAWIYDKLEDWSDNRDGLPWTDDEVCLWVSLYIFSRAGPDASSYIYYEALHDNKMSIPVIQSYIDIPLGIADFPVELANMPVSWRKTMGPIVFQEFYDKGGHFAGWERPNDLADGLCKMFGKGGGAHGVVAGRSGY